MVVVGGGCRCGCGGWFSDLKFFDNVVADQQSKIEICIIKIRSGTCRASFYLSLLSWMQVSNLKAFFWSEFESFKRI
jgi:hypothetical protein